METKKEWSFSDDKEKMQDFHLLPMEEFMQMYSYLTEKEYYSTLQEFIPF